MEINTNNLAANSLSLNKSTVGQDVLARTLEKTQEVEKKSQIPPPQAAEASKSSKKGLIDLYA